MELETTDTCGPLSCERNVQEHNETNIIQLVIELVIQLATEQARQLVIELVTQLVIELLLKLAKQLVIPNRAGRSVIYRCKVRSMS